MVDYKINMLNKNRSIFYAIFSICFFIYSVSPLLYAHKYEHVAGDVQLKPLRLFVVDLILSKLAQKDREEKKTSSALQFLLKKTRAAVSVGKSLYLSKYPTKKADIASDVIIYYEPAFTQTLSGSSRSKPDSDFYLSYSGLSPPAV